MAAPDPLVTVRDLSFRYPETLSGRSITALRHISMDIQAGEIVLVTGPSGSGKSTLARCLNGLIPHATNGTMTGTVIVKGMSTNEHDVPEFASCVGMVFQDPGSQLVAGEVESEIAFGLEIQNLREQEIRDRIDQVSGLLRISHLRDRLVSDLSWGERQRVAIASVIAMRPPVLVLDEPFSGIDAAAARDLADLFGDLNAELGTTIIIFEHRVAYVLPIIDHFVALDGGRIVSDGKPRASIQTPNQGMPGSGELSPAATISPPGKNTGDRPLCFSAGQIPVPSLSMRDVWFRYPGSRSLALEGLALDFYPHEITVITGANGSGKTTLLKHCNGLLIPDSGDVFTGSESLAQKTVATISHRVGLLNQHADYQIFESTVSEELAFGPRNLGKTDEEIRKVTEDARRRCMLTRIDPSTPPLGLSGGEKQRVALAGILAMDTPVIILDEPTFGLDQELKKSLAGLLRELCDAGKTVILATHDEEFGAACGDRFIHVVGGRIVDDYRKPSRTSGETVSGKTVNKATGGEPTGEY